MGALYRGELAVHCAILGAPLIQTERCAVESYTTAALMVGM